MAKRISTALETVSPFQDTIGLQEELEFRRPITIVHLPQAVEISSSKTAKASIMWSKTFKREVLKAMRDAKSSAKKYVLVTVRRMLSAAMIAGVFVLAFAVFALLPPAHLLGFFEHSTQIYVLASLGALAIGEIAFGLIGFVRTINK